MSSAMGNGKTIFLTQHIIFNNFQKNNTTIFRMNNDKNKAKFKFKPLKCHLNEPNSTVTLDSELPLFPYEAKTVDQVTMASKTNDKSIVQKRLLINLNDYLTLTEEDKANIVADVKHSSKLVSKVILQKMKFKDPNKSYKQQQTKQTRPNMQQQSIEPSIKVTSTQKINDKSIEHHSNNELSQKVEPVYILVENTNIDDISNQTINLLPSKPVTFNNITPKLIKIKSVNQTPIILQNKLSGQQKGVSVNTKKVMKKKSVKTKLKHNLAVQLTTSQEDKNISIITSNSQQDNLFTNNSYQERTKIFPVALKPSDCNSFEQVRIFDHSFVNDNEMQILGI